MKRKIIKNDIKSRRENFIKKSKKKHGDKYDYRKIDYINNLTRVEIICPIHGSFFQTPNKHSSGAECQKCKGGIRFSSKEFIEKCIGKHNGYYCYKNTKYNGAQNKIVVTCFEHGDFEILARTHIKGSRCPKCVSEQRKNLIFSTADYILRAKDVHGDLYDYTDVVYKGIDEKIKIKCKKHGYFFIKASKHLYRKFGCQFCRNSKGEFFIKKILEENEIKYIHQKSFDDCRYKYPLIFDFYIPSKKILIEFDGVQHFHPIEFFGGKMGFKKRKICDGIKNKYAIKKKIKLIRVSYALGDNEVKKILMKELS